MQCLAEQQPLDCISRLVALDCTVFVGGATKVPIFAFSACSLSWDVSIVGFAGGGILLHVGLDPTGGFCASKFPARVCNIHLLLLLQLVVSPCSFESCLDMPSLAVSILEPSN